MPLSILMKHLEPAVPRTSEMAGQKVRFRRGRRTETTRHRLTVPSHVCSERYTLPGSAGTSMQTMLPSQKWPLKCCNIPFDVSVLTLAIPYPLNLHYMY